MNRDELLAQLDYMENVECVDERAMNALQKIVDLHSPHDKSEMIHEENQLPYGMTKYAVCGECSIDDEIENEYPCATIQAIMGALI